MISLATSVDNIPYVRTVNAYYEDGVFYVITYALSSKICQIKQNPTVAISGDWFTAHGEASDLGYILSSVFNVKRISVIAFSVTYVTSYVNVGEKMHLNSQSSVSVAGFTSSALDIK